MLPALSQEEVSRYTRQLIIPEVGLEGQRRLKASSVLIVGLGGLGSSAALYLAAAGIGRIGLVDDDVVDQSNLQRQVLYGQRQVGQLKVDAALERLTDLNLAIQVDTFCESFNAKTAQQIASGYDILLDCTDNFPARYLINDLCVRTGRPDVYGAVHRFEGQVSVFDARQGPCYRCVFSQPPQPDTAPGCALSGVFGVLPGVIGSLQAAEAVKLALGVGQPLIGRLLIYDALEAAFQTVNLPKKSDCRICGQHADIHALIDDAQECNPNAGIVLYAADEISPEALALRLGQFDAPLLLDVRDAVELQVSSLPGAILIPLSQLSARLEELDRERELVVFCRSGVRSARALLLLRAANFLRVRNLVGGINAWAKQVDPGMYKY